MQSISEHQVSRRDLHFRASMNRDPVFRTMQRIKESSSKCILFLCKASNLLLGTRYARPAHAAHCSDALRTP